VTADCLYTRPNFRFDLERGLNSVKKSRTKVPHQPIKSRRNDRHNAVAAGRQSTVGGKGSGPVHHVFKKAGFRVRGSENNEKRRRGKQKTVNKETRGACGTLLNGGPGDALLFE